MDTLLLNSDGTPLSLMPLSAVNWHTAIRLVALEKVRVLTWHDGWEIHSPSVTMEVPSIVICTEYQKWKRGVKYSRSGILIRDNFTCQFCGAKPQMNLLTLDHVVPRSKGGKTNWTNIVTACKDCNANKGNNERIRPKYMPVKPTYYELLAKRKKYPVRIADPEWAAYLGWDENLVLLVPPKKTK